MASIVELEPAAEIARIPGCPASIWPISLPAFKIFTSPAGQFAANRASPKICVVIAECSETLITTAFPAAKAGAKRSTTIRKDKAQGVTIPTSPVARTCASEVFECNRASAVSFKIRIETSTEFCNTNSCDNP
ncbi:hypothetical protein D3C87_1368410 [compost metagenome]